MHLQMGPGEAISSKASTGRDKIRNTDDVFLRQDFNHKTRVLMIIFLLPHISRR